MEDRLEQIGMLWQDTARDGGFSLKTLVNLRYGKVENIQARTTHKIDAGFHWERGSVARVLREEGDPVPLAGGRPLPASAAAAGPDDGTLHPYVMWVRRDLDLAEAKHGLAFTGAEAFGDEREAAVWDEADLAPDIRVLLLAKMRRAQDARSDTGLPVMPSSHLVRTTCK
jgi:hypothetical protein